MADRQEQIDALLKRREELSWSPMRQARVDRELQRLGYSKDAPVDKSARAEKPVEKVDTSQPKRKYTKRSDKWGE